MPPLLWFRRGGILAAGFLQAHLLGTACSALLVSA